MLKPPGLNRFRQIGLPQTVSDSVESASCAVCTLAKIDAAVLVRLIALPVPFKCGFGSIRIHSAFDVKTDEPRAAIPIRLIESAESIANRCSNPIGFPNHKRPMIFLIHPSM